MTALRVPVEALEPTWTPPLAVPSAVPTPANDDRSAAGLRAEIRARRQARQDAEQQRVKALDDPWREAGADKETRRLLREAREARSEADQAQAAARAYRGRKMFSDAQRAGEGAARALAMAVAKEREAQGLLDQRRNVRWSGAVQEERAALERMRGGQCEKVFAEVSDWVRDGDTGAMIRGDDGLPVLGVSRSQTLRVVTSEGLRMAFEAGCLEGEIYSAERLWEIAKRYRDAFETYASLASPARDPGSPAVRRCKPSTGPQDAAFAAGEHLSIMRGRLTDRQIGRRREIGLAGLVQMTPLQVVVADRVCGADETCAATARVLGRDHRTVKKALREAMVVAMLNLAAE
ncbi:MAG: hypothetical protein KA105_02715 [Caulobacter sp.]|nr:hypothetical protein [Caulobacter sp.]